MKKKKNKKNKNVFDTNPYFRKENYECEETDTAGEAMMQMEADLSQALKENYEREKTDTATETMMRMEEQVDEASKAES